MKCKKCGTKKITKFYKDYCKTCSVEEKSVNRIVNTKKMETSKVLQTGVCHICGGQMDRLSGQYGIFYKCQKKPCGATKDELGRVKAKPNTEMQQILNRLDERKKSIKKHKRTVYQK